MNEYSNSSYRNSILHNKREMAGIVRRTWELRHEPHVSVIKNAKKSQQLFRASCNIIISLFTYVDVANIYYRPLTQHSLIKYIYAYKTKMEDNH